MNDELLKKLKDAGFPGLEARCNGDCDKCNRKYQPTLSELIEACNLSVFQLTKDASGYWRANGKGGETSEEAVAHLWLQLNATGSK